TIDHAERVMMLDQRLQCFLHPFRIKALLGVKHHRLVPVVLVREVLFKEPALDRRQDDFALYRALVCLFAFGTLYILGQLFDRPSDAGRDLSFPASSRAG
ncbi:hypothetical protein ACUWE6_00040, partial [Bacillus subtilis subsp. subtilis]